MKYEFRVWNDKAQMPKTFTPRKAKGLLEGINSAINDANAVAARAGVPGAQNAQNDNPFKNPNILIDAKCGEDVITSVNVTFSTSTIEEGEVKTTKRLIEIDMSGNLYLPLDTGLEDAAKDMVGLTKGASNKLRDTLLLSKWAAVKPEEANAQQNAGAGAGAGAGAVAAAAGQAQEAPQTYYRAVLLCIMTKAGDFRMIAADNVYVDEYTETYHEGEFGTFKIKLKQKIDATSTFTITGLGYEKLSLLGKIGKAVEATAKVAAVVGTTAAVAGTVVKATTETVEKFTGETAATRKLKGISAATAAAGNTTKNASSLATNIRKKQYDKLADDTTNLSKSGNELVQTSKAAHGNAAIPLKEMEDNYLAVLKKDPKDYEKYKAANDSEKRKMLEEASAKMRDRLAITKEYEQSTINSNKANIENHNEAKKEKEEQKKKEKEKKKKQQEEEERDKTIGFVKNLPGFIDAIFGTSTDTVTTGATTPPTDTGTTPSTPSTDKNTNPSTPNNNNSGGNNSGNGNGTMRGGTGLDNLISNAANNKNGGGKK